MNTVITGTIIVFLALGAVVLTVAGFGCGGETPDATSKQIDQPTASQASNTGLEALLSGETLARYQALPPAFQDALASYVWYGVPSALVPLAVRDKIEQWGDNAVPLDELISAERAQRFRERDSPEEHADLLLSGYVYLLVSDNEPERRNELMRELARDPIGEASAAMGDEPDSQSGSLTWFAPPPYQNVLTQTALDRLDILGPEIKEGLFDAQNSANDGSMQSREMATWLTSVEIFLLRVEPEFDVPELSVQVTSDALDAFKGMSATGQSLANETYRNMLIVNAVRRIALLGPTRSDFVKPPNLSDAELAREAESIIEWASAVDAHKRTNP